MFSLLDRLRARFSRLWRDHQRSNAFRIVVDATSMSAEPARRELLVVGSQDKPKWVKFRCPCGCGEVLALNLMQSHFPRWAIARDDANRLTVSPSVHSTTCGAHFFVRSNRVEWCP